MRAVAIYCIARRRNAGRSPVKLALKFLQLVTLAVLALSSSAHAATEIMWWHAMSGQLGKQLEKLAADFNASQPDYRIVPAYNGR